MNGEHFLDLVTDRMARVESAKRILGDDLKDTCQAPTVRPEIRFEWLAEQLQRSAIGIAVTAKKCGKGRFTASRLTDQTERFALAEGEGDAADGMVTLAAIRQK